MKHLQGKVKAISVKEVTEGMQLICWFYDQYLIGVIDKELNWISRDKNSGGSITCPTTNRDTKGELKTLVVEYEDTHHSHYEVSQNPIIKQLPLKYSQWQSAIDNGEVDYDKIVKFEVIQVYQSEEKLGPYGQFRGYKTKSITDYAKIIPQKKRMYSEDELVDKMEMYAKYLHYNPTGQSARDWLNDKL